MDFSWITKISHGGKNIFIADDFITFGLKIDINNSMFGHQSREILEIKSTMK